MSFLFIGIVPDQETYHLDFPPIIKNLLFIIKYILVMKKIEFRICYWDDECGK